MEQDHLFFYIWTAAVIGSFLIRKGLEKSSREEDVQHLTLPCQIISTLKGLGYVHTALF